MDNKSTTEGTSVFRVRTHFNERLGKSGAALSGEGGSKPQSQSVDPLLAICSQFSHASEGDSCQQRNQELLDLPDSHSTEAQRATATEGVRVDQIKKFNSNLSATFGSLVGGSGDPLAANREASISSSTFGGVAMGLGFRSSSATEPVRGAPTAATGEKTSGLAALLAMTKKGSKGSRGLSSSQGNGAGGGLRSTSTGAAPVSATKMVNATKVLNELFTHWVIHSKNHQVISAASSSAGASESGTSTSRSRVLPVDVGLRVQLCDGAKRRGVLQSATQYTGTIQWDDPDAAKTGPLELSDLQLVDSAPLHADTLIPCGETEAKGSCVVVFQRSLQVCNGDKITAFKLAMAVTSLASEARRQVHAAAQIPAHVAIQKTVTVKRIETASGPSVIELTYGDFTAPLLEPYYRKLQHLYVPTRTQQQVLSSYQEAVPEESKAEFLFRVMTLLMRYYGLAGALGDDSDQNAGFHAAIHPNLALGLQQFLGVSAECFASPLNTNQRHFCSLFPDTDCWFGSLGPFWDFHPLQGSFHVNPPFETHVMLRTAQHLEKLLSSPDAGPLSFFIVLPAWDHGKMDEALLTLKDGPHSKRYALIPAQASTYVDGHQHVLAHSSFVIRSDTHAFLLQNAQGEKKWPAAGFDQAIALWTGQGQATAGDNNTQAVQSSRGKRSRSPSETQQ